MLRARACSCKGVRLLPSGIKRCEGWGGGRVLVLLDREGQNVGCTVHGYKSRYVLKQTHKQTTTISATIIFLCVKIQILFESMFIIK